MLQNFKEESQKESKWILLSVFLLVNYQFLKLYKSCEFRLVGFSEKNGKLYVVWKDVYLMERRSKVVGFKDKN